MKQERQIKYIKDKLVSTIQPEKIILFGSHLTDKSNRDSDIDLLIIINDSNYMASMKRYDRELQVSNLFYPRLFAIDNLVYTSGEIQNLSESNEGEWDLVLEILGEGKILYER